MHNDVGQSVGFLLHDAARLVRSAFDARARALGVTRQQWRTLIYLARREGQTQSELADSLEVERITLCRMVDRLADAGLVERRADPADRRVWRLHLLPPSRQLVDQLAAIGREIEDETLALLAPEERTQLKESLIRVRDGLRTIEGSARNVA